MYVHDCTRGGGGMLFFVTASVGAKICFFCFVLFRAAHRRPPAVLCFDHWVEHYLKGIQVCTLCRLSVLFDPCQLGLVIVADRAA